MKNKWISVNFLRFSLALVLLLFLVYSIGIVEIVNTFRQINLSIGIAVGLCIVMYMTIGAFNAWLLINTLQPLPFPVFLRAYFYSWVSGLITPGQAGDVSLIFFLKKYDISLQNSGISYLTDKSITLLVFFCIGWYGSYILVPELKFIWFPIGAVVILTLTVFFMLVRFSPKYFQVINKSCHFLHSFSILKKKKKILTINILLTFVKWLAVSLCYFSAFLCFNVNTVWPEIGIIPILSTLVGYIPVSIGGIGTVELTATQLFSRVGVEPSAVLSTYLLIRSIQYCLAIILLIFFRWYNPVFKKPN